MLKHPAPTLPELAKRLTPLTESADRVSAGGSSFWGSQETAERPARGQGQSREILSSSYTRRREASACPRGSEVECTIKVRPLTSSSTAATSNLCLPLPELRRIEGLDGANAKSNWSRPQHANTQASPV